jgi:hypothetical protein
VWAAGCCRHWPSVASCPTRLRYSALVYTVHLHVHLQEHSGITAEPRCCPLPAASVPPGTDTGGAARRSAEERTRQESNRGTGVSGPGPGELTSLASAPPRSRLLGRRAHSRGSPHRVYRGPYKVRVEEKAVPGIEHPNDAIVRVSLGAICGSDLHLYHGQPGWTRQVPFAGVFPGAVRRTVVTRTEGLPGAGVHPSVSSRADGRSP